MNWSVFIVIVAFVAIFVWWREPPPPTTKIEYIDQITLPIEAFGANWRVQVFRPRIPFPSGFDDAYERTSAAAQKLQHDWDMPVTITFAPRWYFVKRPIILAPNISIHGGRFRGMHNGDMLTVKATQ